MTETNNTRFPKEFLEFLPLGDDFAGLAELMRRAGRSEEEIAHALEEARRLRNLEPPTGDTAAE